MKVISRTTENDIANVYIAQDAKGRWVEFVESIQPPLSIREKWVTIVSTLYGCPVKCTFCDAGGNYGGKLSSAEILFQVEELIRRRFPSGNPETRRFKVQFSRMGEPSFNPAVIEALELLAGRFPNTLFIPSLSTIAPAGTNGFFEDLLVVKKEHYNPTFQLQFSIHSTDPRQRDLWMPVRKWEFSEIAAYGDRFYHPAGKKITLNFAVSTGSIIDPTAIIRVFSPAKFLVKLTPVNPTARSKENNIHSAIGEEEKEHSLVEEFRQLGFEVILSIGEREENRIGSNCGQYISRYLGTSRKGNSGDSYSYAIKDISQDNILPSEDTFPLPD